MFCKKDEVLEENSADIKNHIEERNFAEEIKVKNIYVSNTVNDINKKSREKNFLMK